MAGVLVGAEVEPGPAIKAALLDVGDVVGDEVVAELVALVHAGPERAGGGVDGEADRVADAGGEERLVLAVGGEGEDAGAALFGLVVVDVGAGTHRDEHALVVGAEGDVAGPVAAAADLL